MEPIWNNGIEIVLWLQGLGAWLATPMQLISFFGDEEFFLLLLPMLFWSVSAPLGMRIGLMLLLSVNLNHLLKLGFHHPRPYWYSPQVVAFSSEATFGLPSGHAQQAAAIWGLFAALTRRPWAWALALALALLIGLSRIYLGVHFPTDVLGGWLVGAVLVWAFVRWEPAVTAQLHRLHRNGQIALALGVSLALVALSVPLLSLTQRELPAAWVQNAAAAGADLLAPFSLDDSVSTAGVLFGLGAGAAWLYSRGWFSAAGPLWQRVARYLLGVVGIVLFWYVLGRLLPRGETLLAYSLRYLRYTLVGLWVSGLAPALFIRLGLAGPADDKVSG
jgi:membrane-associated phospholipid phosphatase